MAIEVATDSVELSQKIQGFQSDPQFQIPRRLPARFAVCRGASQAPEILIAKDDVEASAIVRKQIKAASGAIPVAFIYTLTSVVEFVPETQVLAPDDWEVAHLDITSIQQKD